MNYNTLTQDAYVAHLVRTISSLEGLDVASASKGDGMATIGFGYTFNRNNNVEIWTNAGIALSTSDFDKLRAIDAAPAAQKTALGLAFTRHLNRDEAKALLYQTYPEFESLANALDMPFSIERSILVAVSYNRGPGAMRRWKEISSAIASGNRAEAWFEIRYHAQGSTVGTKNELGLVKRRYVESEAFGLYDPKC